MPAAAGRLLSGWMALPGCCLQGRSDPRQGRVLEADLVCSTAMAAWVMTGLVQLGLVKAKDCLPVPRAPQNLPPNPLLSSRQNHPVNLHSACHCPLLDPDRHQPNQQRGSQWVEPGVAAQPGSQASAKVFEVSGHRADPPATAVIRRLATAPRVAKLAALRGLAASSAMVPVGRGPSSCPNQDWWAGHPKNSPLVHLYRVPLDWPTQLAEEHRHLGSMRVTDVASLPPTLPLDQNGLLLHQLAH